MSNWIQNSLCRLLTLLALFSILPGCGTGSSVDRFHPREDAALGALTTALTAWQNGQAMSDAIESSEPAVQMADPTWQAGSKLKSFEIVEALPGDIPRKFSVKITLEGSAVPENVTYVVVGKDPLWVMREQEYEKSDM